MIRTILVTALLTLPTLAAAQSNCQDRHEARNCAEGQQWNTATGACELIVSG